MTQQATEPTEETTTEPEAEQTEEPTTEPEQSSTEETEGTEPDPDTFPKQYVQQLRQESKDHRMRAKEATDRAEALAQRLHTALVAATGRLVDAGELPYDPAHLDDPDKLTASIDALLAQKPYLASRRPVGNVGQGETGGTGGTVDLAALLRSRA